MGLTTSGAPLQGGAVGVGTDLTTKGDTHTCDTAQQRLGVGTNGQVYTAASGEATGVKWARPEAGKCSLQSTPKLTN